MNYIESFANLTEFARHSKRLYLYGAGHYGMLCRTYLEKQKLAVNGFIMSGMPEMHDVDGIPVLFATDILPQFESGDGIVLAMKPEFQAEVMASLGSTSARFFPLTPEMMFCLDQMESISVFTALARDYPAQPFTHLSEYKNILIVRLDVIGDMIWTSAFFRELRRAVPNAHITLVLRRDVYDLMRECPYLDELICYDLPADQVVSEDFSRMQARAQAFATKYLAGRDFDLVFLPRFMHFHDCQENIFLAAYSGAQVRIGRVDATCENGRLAGEVLRTMFSKLAIESNICHEVEHILGLLNLCGITPVDSHMELWLDKEDIRFAEEKLCNCQGLRLAIALAAREGNRSWSAGKYRCFMNILAKACQGEITFVLLGGKDTMAVHEELADVSNCLHMAGNTNLRQAAALISQCDIYVGPMTGLMHMAGASGIPVIELSAELLSSKYRGACSPLRTGAYGVPHISLQPEHGLDSKCEEVGYCVKKYPHCLDQISPEAVVGAVQEMLKVLKSRK